MSSLSKPRVVMLGSSFAGLTGGRCISHHAGDAAEPVVIDRNPHLTFGPNIQLEVLADPDSLKSMLLDTPKIHATDGNIFLNADVVVVDREARVIRAHLPRNAIYAAQQGLSSEAAASIPTPLNTRVPRQGARVADCTQQ